MIIRFNDITVGSNDSCDIKISSSKIIDPNGTVELGKSNTIVYKIKNNNSYRRLIFLYTITNQALIFH